ncbi:tRNA threonylcarbamoyladenosine dehydratase [Haloplasma contractile]|uniref:Glutamate racemase protein n=1 Tax=Haloplasma contractile SSD-17B TaxID=1033810 RepID=U2FIE3_9MOLU|nr:tRNA threonylcarbamoyladenosine dehydratase [Haloplasma contractile]ERJ10994.1 glutamate racemase protein [Haloplasma contractile SSD-17B]
MLNQFSRTQLLIGKEGMETLQNSRIAVFGIGGVGGFAVEALVRSGVKTFDLFDDDLVCLTNLNRQVIATRKTVGKYKVDVMKERILEINPKCTVNIYKTFFLPNNSVEVDFSQYDYVIDAVDTISAKIELVLRAEEANVPIISAMGAGNKMDPTKLEITDIYKTSMCPLARVMRRELRKRGVKKLKVIYSTEKPLELFKDKGNSCRTNCICPQAAKRTCTIRRDIPGSNSFVPSTTGLIAASEVVRDLTQIA